MTDNNYYEIDLDIWKQFPLKKITTKQLDIGRKIRINLFSNGFTYNVSNSEVVFYMKKGNENIVFNSCNTIKNNIIEIEITSAMVDNPGNYEIEIHIISGGISTFKFELTVEETIMDTKAIASTSEYLALVNAYKKYNELSSQIDENTKYLENRIDNIVVESGNNPTQIQDSLIDVTNKNHDTLNQRLNSDTNFILGLNKNIIKLNYNLNGEVIKIEEINDNNETISTTNIEYKDGIVSKVTDKIGINTTITTFNFDNNNQLEKIIRS